MDRRKLSHTDVSIKYECQRPAVIVIAVNDRLLNEQHQVMVYEEGAFLAVCNSFILQLYSSCADHPLSPTF